MNAVSTWHHEPDEAAIIASVSLDAPWALVERFSTLVRDSGSKVERRAIDLIDARPGWRGVEHHRTGEPPGHPFGQILRR